MKLFRLNEFIDMKNKMRRRNGFTLAEVLLAMLILLLVSGIVAGGIPAAINAYKKVVLSANAHALISTTMVELRDKLALAKEVKPSGSTLEFVSNDGRKYSLSLKDKDGLYLEDITGDGSDASRLLVSDPATTKELYAKFESVSFADGKTNVIKFTDLCVCNKSSTKEDDKGYVSVDDFMVEIINLR